METADAAGNLAGNLYEIRIRGLIPPRWVGWFEGFEIQALENGETRLIGRVADSSALYGMIDRLRDLNLQLIGVKCLEPGAEG